MPALPEEKSPELMITDPGSPVAGQRPSRRQLANAIRALSMDAVQRANSGHPGMPMGMADIAEVLWNDFLKHNPANPAWPDRDRFVLSNGHGSMLLYALAHLSGYPLSMDELRDFRQLDSRTPGHPERDLAIGVETTTGPLGQGISNAVGMALAEKILAAQFNRPDFPIVDHHTYVFLGDGCLMEGVSHEACSLAATLGLGKLIALYDDNGISIDGEITGWFTDDTPARFRAYGWHVLDDVDGHDANAVHAALLAAQQHNDAPTLICCKTVIGWGAPHKQGTAATHGSPLGADEVEAARRAIHWPYPPFEVPHNIRAAWNATERGAAREAQWQALFSEYQSRYPFEAEEFQRRTAGRLPQRWETLCAEVVEQVDSEAEDMATRKASERALNGYGPELPELIGGSADLTGSNNTFFSGSKTVSAAHGDGNYIHFGVREFGMTAILNGLALHGGFIPYGGTFLTFSDYARNALRMAALMEIRTILVLTHDSIGLGEDGPTHQPVEHLASLRLMPNMRVWRPCDSVETAVAWQDAIEWSRGPTSLVLSRQGLPYQPRTADQRAAIRRGAYILFASSDPPRLILLATGSEVALALAAARQLDAEGVAVRLVSMPCTQAFDSQPEEYKQHVLPEQVSARLAIEAGATDGWWRFVGSRGAVLGIDRFGKSAPAGALFEAYGFSLDSVVESARALL